MCTNAHKSALPVTDEIESVSADMSAIHDKIFEIEELRHNPTERSAHASQLDTLLSQVNDWIDALAPQIDALPPNTELVYLKKDWGRILAQQVSLKQEMLEDPWLIRFRT
jgi:hypothetical protein